MLAEVLVAVEVDAHTAVLEFITRVLLQLHVSILHADRQVVAVLAGAH